MLHQRSFLYWEDSEAKKQGNDHLRVSLLMVCNEIIQNKVGAFAYG